MNLSTEDRLAIHQLISLYGHIIDQREFSRLTEIFTDEAVFDLSDYAEGGPSYQGLEEITKLMLSSQEHPVAHHATNIVVNVHSEDWATVISKGLGVGHGGKVGSVVYRDTVIRNEIGWRISERLVSLRSLEKIPSPS